ncbi:chemotaxis response regulator protein-glutamate methylesterase [bacterium]|nr:chemotaxis response regulator protein-glutamate methylesterase [bacterium]
MIRVLVVDDSAFSRKTISKILESIPGVEVVDTAPDGQDALKKVMRLRPDLITLDLEMPLMDGFTFLRWVMNTMSTPVIVVSAQEADENVFKAMDLGAVDFVVKPTKYASVQLEDIKNDLIEKVLATPLLEMQKVKARIQAQAVKETQETKQIQPDEIPKIIGIASSTGGPTAIHSILNSLPSNFPVPIVIAQHMPPSFTAMFAERLNKYTPLTVKEAEQDDLILPSRAYVAPGGKHLSIEKRSNKLYARLLKKETEVRHCPSANVLFRSIAEELQSRSVGAVLTGMGDDGKEGMKYIKDKGGITIAESEKSAIIFGMPKESIKAGIVDYVLSLDDISSHLMWLCESPQRL